MAKVQVEINEQDLWEAVFGSRGFSFGDHWIDYEYLDGAEWNKIGRIRIWAYNENDKKVQKTIGLAQILKALPIANEQVYMDLFNLDNYDAVCADAVLQVAVLGKVIYG